MDIVNITRWLAGALTIAFIPQVVRTWKTRSAQDISLFMFLLFSCGVLLWLIYGILLHALPISSWPTASPWCCRHQSWR